MYSQSESIMKKEQKLIQKPTLKDHIRKVQEIR